MGWFLLTVVLPMVAPILLIAPFWALPLPPVFAAQAKLLMPVKDGQLCWASLGFCVSALYEAAEPGAGKPLDPSIAKWASGGLIVLLVASGLMAVGGAIFSTPLGAPPGTPWYRHYSALVASAGLTGLAAGAYTVLHFSINPSCDEATVTTWVEDHFRDAKHARETLAVGSFVAGLVGFLLVVLSVTLSR